MALLKEFKDDILKLEKGGLVKALKLLLCLALLMTVATKSFAQEESEVENDTPSIVPQPGTTQQPIIMDESDSSGVSDVDEYDG